MWFSENQCVEAQRCSPEVCWELVTPQPHNPTIPPPDTSQWGKCSIPSMCLAVVTRPQWWSQGRSSPNHPHVMMSGCSIPNKKNGQAGEEQYHCKQTSPHQKQSSTWPIRLQVTLPSTSRKASRVPVNFRSLISQVITDKQVKHVWQALQKKLFPCLQDAFQDRPQVLQLLIRSFTRWHSAIGLIQRTFKLPIAWKDMGVS